MDTSVDFPGESLFDFSSIESLDPSIVEGFRVLYEREVPLEIRTQSFDGELTKPNLLVCAYHPRSPVYIYLVSIFIFSLGVYRRASKLRF